MFNCSLVLLCFLTLNTYANVNSIVPQWLVLVPFIFSTEFGFLQFIQLCVSNATHIVCRTPPSTSVSSRSNNGPINDFFTRPAGRIDTALLYRQIQLTTILNNVLLPFKMNLSCRMTRSGRLMRYSYQSRQNR
jgi:hypothetical protein